MKYKVTIRKKEQAAATAQAPIQFSIRKPSSLREQSATWKVSIRKSGSQAQAKKGFSIRKPGSVRGPNGSGAFSIRRNHSVKDTIKIK